MVQALLDLVDDTVKYYSNNPRARKSKEGNCLYTTEDGHNCAAGRLMTPEAKKFLKEHHHNSASIECAIKCANQSDIQLFKEEYQDVPIEVLKELQAIHDHDHYWTEENYTGNSRELTSIGEKKVKKLKTMIKENYG